ncbi:hypothetical protein GCM10022225_07480 [Plantactinospora mayteni]|uniref:Carbohydrate kinase PfkB domain-containing protein n=1 Tax=Plantactinospora mayteni TaxID=566021 RepID=A0ABQ4EIR1_9ACTN|nr:hypothetical protein [Plantactinospora mayteni]GIG94505.1 hypothetical protein Pma05_10780 [Plantactinospora mayteni]
MGHTSRLARYSGIDLESDRSDPILVCIGQLVVDVVVKDVSNRWPDGSWTQEDCSISIQIGGAPLHACAGFGDAGYGSVVVSLLGGAEAIQGGVRPDDLGQYVLACLEQRGQAYDLEIRAGVPTGRIVLLYPRHVGRVMLTDAPGLARMSPEHVAGAIERAAAARRPLVVSLSGYVQFEDTFAEISAAVRSAAKRTGALLWIDVVPHDIYQDISFADFLESVREADILSIDEETCEGFAGSSGTSLSRVISRLCELESTLFVSRPDGLVLACGEQRSTMIPEDHQSGSGLPGHGDRLVAAAVARHVRARFRDAADRSTQVR